MVVPRVLAATVAAISLAAVTAASSAAVSVDEKQGVVTHHVQSALFPGDTGTSIRRHLRLAGDELNHTFTTTLHDGTPVVRPLVWNRMK